MPPNITENELGALASRPWSVMLGIEVVAKPLPSQSIDNEYMSACIAIVGEAKYDLFMDCSLPLLIQGASAMFGIPEGEVQHDELKDALGELTNMTGGAIQQLLDGDNQLTLPVVTSTRPKILSIPPALTLFSTYLENKHGGVVVRLVSTEQKTGFNRGIL